LNISKKGIYAFIISAVITSSFFFSMPTKMPRPPLAAASFFDTALMTLWNFDTAKNAFPSQHVAFSFVCALILATAYKKIGWLPILMASLIAVSTVLIKQHYVWAVVGGIIVALFAYWWAFVRSEKVAVASRALES
jgi:membrane-associated phospholipid phosphatase